MKKKLYLCFLSAILAILFAAGCGKKPTVIDPSEYLTLTFSGYDGFGTFESKNFDAAALRSDYEEELGDITKNKLTSLFANGATLSITDNSSYSNGDKISITWNVDEETLTEIEEECNVSFTLVDFEYIVTGLTDVVKFDPFEGLKVTADGIAPNGTLSITETGYSSLRYYFETEDGDTASRLYNVSNGDTVKIVLSSGGSSVEQYCLNSLGMVPTSTSMEYTVTGLSEYVTDLSAVPASISDEIKNATESSIRAQAESWIIPDSLREITCVGDALTVYTGTSTSYYIDHNTYIVLFKVDIDSPRDGAFSYYFTGSVTNMIKSSDSTYTYDTLTVPTVSTGWWVSGTYLKYNDLYYAGYESYDSMYEALIEKNSEEYVTYDSFDTSICEKQTHVPIDFTVIDATVTLEPEDVVCLRKDGYNTIVGFSQSGYDKITAYDPSEQIKLILPSADTEGSDVDNVHFYANAVGFSDGFNLNTLLETSTCPRLYIVAPESAIRFNGFRNASINSDYIYKISGVELGSRINTLGDYAFSGITGIKNITIPAGVAVIPYECFYNCTGLLSVTFEGSISTFGDYCFSGCTNLVLEELRLDSQQIDSGAFNGVTIESLVLCSDNYHANNSWDNGSWTGANVLSITIEDGVTVINKYCFKDITTVTEVVIPDSVTSIGYAAFRDCTALTSVVLPAQLPSLADYAFSGCEALIIDSITLDENTSLKNHCLYGVTVNNMTLASDKYTGTDGWSWSENKLAGCNVKNFVIADNVTTINAYVFDGVKYCNTITLPGGVTTIAANAFSGYDDLIKLVCTSGVTSIAKDIGLGSNVTVYAPKGSAMITYCINKGIKYEETE